MKPFYAFSDEQRDGLRELLETVPGNPYEDYVAFSRAVAGIGERIPEFFRDMCSRIRRERESGVSDVHVLRNCPVDAVVPELSPDDPVGDKYAKKHTFVAEAFLELFCQATGTPLMAYGSRNNGDFFTDVVAISRYHGMQTGFSDSELVFHNDRTAHWARADFICLLGMRCPQEEVIYTTFVDGRSLLAHLTPDQQEVLRKPYYVTPFDVFSRDTNSRQVVSEDHPILENDRSFRYLETCTTVAHGAPPEAKDALIAMKDAVVKATKQRHRLFDGDLLVFANQDGLHSRDRIEINDTARAATRWLLKTYAFRDHAAADRLDGRWLGGVRGRIAD
ncbi:TauD/TfdA family dioxygenase [Sphaerisporangium sp. TRM90804]|uniref:TauD/TfdA family dioxygenase n=1 Tax=Sphaerisporangium sp. TRM90804 TaxID=3031113 RepID=UPI00244A3CFB|nr:TauD/TfdA family dioxygenase [Sphaerisporangium sp. TRM90804]MDH2427999.1 TauD/TfdA family dioxygenase [Sphaerisporangium sp. TRM90804]